MKKRRPRCWWCRNHEPDLMPHIIEVFWDDTTVVSLIALFHPDCYQKWYTWWTSGDPVEADEMPGWPPSLEEDD